MILMNSSTPSSARLNADEQRKRLAQAIDHTKLTFKPDENEEQAIQTLCQEAKTSSFYAVCVRPRHIALAKQLLQDSLVKVATVIGFPPEKVKLEVERTQPTVGNFTTPAKTQEAADAVRAGADELDLVINVGDLKNGQEAAIRQELLDVRAAAQGRPIKVIIETDLLTPDEIATASRLCAETNMSMVKTSTGMVDGGQGATLEAVKQIRNVLDRTNPAVGIKASGGIKNQAQANAFLDLGVNRLGTSSGLAILQGDASDSQNDY